MTVVYEDFIANYDETVTATLDFLGLPHAQPGPLPARYEKIADALSEEWVQRYRSERQKTWGSAAW